MWLPYPPSLRIDRYQSLSQRFFIVIDVDEHDGVLVECIEADESSEIVESADALKACSTVMGTLRVMVVDISTHAERNRSM